MRLFATDMSRQKLYKSLLWCSQDSTLRKVSTLIDWQRLSAVPDPVRSRLRRPVVIVDATIVECTAHAVSVSERLSTDPNARWIKKGGHCRFGCQGFVTSRGWILERTFGPLIRRLGATRSWFMGY